MSFFLPYLPKCWHYRCMPPCPPSPPTNTIIHPSFHTSYVLPFSSSSAHLSIHIPLYSFVHPASQASIYSCMHAFIHAPSMHPFTHPPKYFSLPLHYSSSSFLSICFFYYSFLPTRLCIHDTPSSRTCSFERKMIKLIKLSYP